MPSSSGTKLGPYEIRLVGEICGSPLRSKGGAGSSTSAAREPDVGERSFGFFLFVASCLSNQSAFSGKRYAISRGDQESATRYLLRGQPFRGGQTPSASPRTESAG